MQLITIYIKQTIMKKESKKIWTIGHSTHSFETFVAMLENFQIEVLADVRRFPGSEKFPQFSKSYFERYLPENGVKYQAIPLLGGRREPKAESGNKVWQNPSFKGYADYMVRRVLEKVFVSSALRQFIIKLQLCVLKLSGGDVTEGLSLII